MRQLLASALIVVALLLGVQHVIRTHPSILGDTFPCTEDGNHARWVLEAQGYDGSSCVYELPWFLAPPGADWTTYCTMWCEPMWPPPPS